jgi:uncharacterized protein YkwD
MEDEPMRGRSISTALVAVLAAGQITLIATTASALTSDENCFYSAMNRERVANGRPRLALAGDLVAIARRHSRWMAGDGRIYHADSSSPHYRQGDDLRSELGGNWYAGGENVGMGGDCSSIHDAFMASPGHRENILDRQYNEVGVGVAYDHDGTVYVTEDFVGRNHAHVRRVAPYRPRYAHRPQAAPRSRPRPKARLATNPQPRTTAILLQLIGLDARRVDSTSGEALGV